MDISTAWRRTPTAPVQRLTASVDTSEQPRRPSPRPRSGSCRNRSPAVKYNRHGGSIGLTADKLPRLFTQFDRSCGCQGVSTSMVTGTWLVMTS
jgi:hypothetical protein